MTNLNLFFRSDERPIYTVKTRRGIPMVKLRDQMKLQVESLVIVLENCEVAVFEPVTVEDWNDDGYSYRIELQCDLGEDLIKSSDLLEMFVDVQNCNRKYKNESIELCGMAFTDSDSNTVYANELLKKSRLRFTN